MNARADNMRPPQGPTRCLQALNANPGCKQKGLTLIETLISLSILALVTVAASQVLQRAAMLKDKIDTQADILSEQLSLEQLISRDILNSNVLLWPSKQCSQTIQCFELEQKTSVKFSKADKPQRLRYRFTEHGLYRDEQYSNTQWRTHNITNTLTDVSFEFFVGQQWVPAADQTGHLRAPNVDANPLAHSHSMLAVEALRVSWYRKDRQLLQQTVLTP